MLEAKMQGLQQNINNCNQGQSILDVADSSLSSVNDILQRLRELAVQAASDTVNDTQRSLIQDEVDAQLAAIQDIAANTNYNGKNLLDGTFANLRLQIGTEMGQNIPLSIDSIQTNILGAVARVTGALSVDANAIAGTGDLTINGITIPGSQSDGVSTINSAASAFAKANAINSVTPSTGVTARANPTVFDATSASITGGALDGTANSLTINGYNIGAVTFLPGDSTGALCSKINTYTASTGVEASLGSNGELVLTAEDGRNIDIATTGSVADELGLSVVDGDVTTIQTGTITLTSDEIITVGGTLDLIGLAAGQSTTFIDTSTAITNLSLRTTDEATAAIDMLDAAINQVLSQRATLGAIGSRIDSTINDIMLNVENLTEANSDIRDADFAVETASLSQAQILQQAGVSILAQANVLPKMALDLLTQ
jgi:flagellin